MEELRTNLERVRLQYALTQVQEHVVAEPIGGLEALAVNDEEYISAHFNGYLKMKVYQRFIQEEGLSLPFFNNIVAPLVYRTCKLGIYLDELALMGSKEIRGFLEIIKLNKRYSNAVFSLLKRARLAVADIPSFARLMQRILTLLDQ